MGVRRWTGFRLFLARFVLVIVRIYNRTASLPYSMPVPI